MRLYLHVAGDWRQPQPQAPSSQLSSDSLQPSSSPISRSLNLSLSLNMNYYNNNKIRPTSSAVPLSDMTRFSVQNPGLAGHHPNRDSAVIKSQGTRAKGSTRLGNQARRAALLRNLKEFTSTV